MLWKRGEHNGKASQFANSVDLPILELKKKLRENEKLKSHACFG